MTHVFSCKFCEISKNTFFTKHLQATPSEKKNNLKRKSTSRAGLANVEATERDLKEYGFLAWLEEYLQLRETKTNLTSFRLDDLEPGSTDHSDFDDTESLDIEPNLNRVRKNMKTTPAAQQAELFVSQSSGNASAAKAQSGSSNDKTDADDLFGEMISQGLKQFSALKKAHSKHLIQSLIYDSQMESSAPKNNLMPQLPVANQPNTNIYGSPVFDRNHLENSNFGYYTNLLNG